MKSIQLTLFILSTITACTSARADTYLYTIDAFGNVTIGGTVVATAFERGGSALTNLPAYVSPWDWGAIGDGVHNDTIALSNAIAFAQKYSLVLRLFGNATNSTPRFAVANLTITNAVVIEGTRPNSDYTGTLSMLMPFSHTSPILIISNGSGYQVAGTTISHVGFNGADPALIECPSCVQLLGGAIHVRFQNCSLVGGTNTVFMQATYTNFATLVTFADCHISTASGTGTSTSAIEMLAPANPGPGTNIFTTDLNIEGGHVQGPTNGWAIMCSNTDVTISGGCYVDATPDHVFYSVAQAWLEVDSTVRLDAGAGANTINVDNHTNLYTDYYYRGRQAWIGQTIRDDLGILHSNCYTLDTKGKLTVPNSSFIGTFDTNLNYVQLIGMDTSEETVITGSADPNANSGILFYAPAPNGNWDWNNGSGSTNQMHLSYTGNLSVAGAVVPAGSVATYLTNVIVAAAANSWRSQLSTANSGFTNTYVKNVYVNVTASSGNVVFWKAGGIGAVNACANPIFTNALSTNGWNRVVPPNCGVQIVSGAVAPVVTVDF